MFFRHRRRHFGNFPINNEEGQVSLVCLTEGAKAVMVRSLGGMNVVRRLSEMGLTPGCEIKLLRKCSFCGPIEIEVRGVSLAIGYCLAQHIFVQPLKVY
ncbi:MAG: ferrous iron transport protein A [Crenarchaeota archaeon]|nr:ferrous iron transport protein A [Thermoproteota archaeon]